MFSDQRVHGLYMALSTASVICGLLGAFWIAWFAVPGLVAGAVPFARVQKTGGTRHGRHSWAGLISILSAAGVILNAVTLIALAVTLSAALSR